jgi:hypothetical protein
MIRNFGWWAIAMLCFTVGCSDSTSPKDSASSDSSKTFAAADANTPTALEPPAAVLTQFLEALRSGNDERAAALLTPVARQKAVALNRNITPPASDTAKFSIGQVKYVSHDGAQVVMKWMDLDENGKWQTDEAVWALRNETEGWRVAGVAWVAFPNEPPVELNFEDPNDIDKKRDWVNQENQRREGGGSLQAREPETGESPLRR